jgi:hypothetical protein
VAAFYFGGKIIAKVRPRVRQNKASIDALFLFSPLGR